MNLKQARLIKKRNEEKVDELYNALDSVLHGHLFTNCGYFITDREMVCPDCNQPHIGRVITKKDGICLKCVIKRAIRMGLSAGRNNES